MKGIILINAYSQNQDYLYQAIRLQEEFTRMGVETEIVRNYCGIAYIDEDGKARFAKKADFAVFLDKDKYTASVMERAGIRLFNRANAIFTCDDKMLTHVALSGKGIPMPESVPAPFCYTPDGMIEDAYCNELIGRLGLPIVIKHSYGSLGREVFLVNDKEELKKKAYELRFTPHFYQKYVKHSFGKDLRVIAVGGKVVGAMVRNSGGTDFRSNMALGGNGTPFAVTKEIETLAKDISDTLELDYCGIDLLFEEDGFTVCEVNSNAFFHGMERVTGVNVAAAYARYIINVIDL